MPRHYVHHNASGVKAGLSLDDIVRSAESQGVTLLAIDGIDIGDIIAGKAQLPRQKADEKREYLFSVEAENRATAQDSVIVIFNAALAAQHVPVYRDFREFLRDYPQAPWKDQIEACLEIEDIGYAQEVLSMDDAEEITPIAELHIFVPGSKNRVAKTYYRGRAAECCLDLLAHFTSITIHKRR